MKLNSGLEARCFLLSEPPCNYVLNPTPHFRKFFIEQLADLFTCYIGENPIRICNLYNTAAACVFSNCDCTPCESAYCDMARNCRGAERKHAYRYRAYYENTESDCADCETSDGN